MQVFGSSDVDAIPNVGSYALSVLNNMKVLE
jgi:hypothetical protein